MLEEAIDNREKGAVPASIGTSLAIESLGGFGEFPSDNPPIRQYETLWVNLRTLFRNLYGSVESGVQTEASAGDLLPALTTDMRVIASTIAHSSNNRMNVVFYICQFTDLEMMFPHAILKKPRTDKQINEYALEQSTLGTLLQNQDQVNDLTVLTFDTKFTERSGNTVILTHYPIDLLWRDRFSYLTLLESHTGKLKEPAEWYTKLTNGKRFERIPFNRLTMQVFGDGNQQFSTMGIRIKRRLLELAEKGRWNSLTTKDRINFTLDQHATEEEKDFFKQLLRQ